MVAIDQYPSAPTVDNNNAQARGWGTGWPACQLDKMAVVVLENGVRLTVRREMAPLIRYLFNYSMRRWGYVIRSSDSGGFNCRAIAGTTIPSNHSWGLAVDVNWNDNPMVSSASNWRSTIPPGMVSFLWAYGFFWGGWYTGTKDPMHFEFVKTPAAVPALEMQARKLWEELAMTTLDDRMSGVFGGRTFAEGIQDTLFIVEGRGGSFLAPTLRSISTRVDQIASAVADLTAPPAPTIDYAQLAAAIRGIVREELAEVLGSVNVETTLVVPSGP